MSLVGHLDFERSDRVDVKRGATLRDLAKTPIDVVVDNLSQTGCLFVLDRELPLGALVSIGIPGIGVRYARVSRVDHPHYACAFLAPINDADIAAALSAETLVAGGFPPLATQTVAELSASVAAEPADMPRLPIGRRIAIIAIVSILLWSMLIAAIVMIAR